MESGEWQVYFELRNGTGGDWGGRSVDAFALGMIPSKRYWRVAYEIKVSRTDFLRELNQPEKREWAEEVAHEFYFVVPAGIVKPEEVPEGCGLLVLQKNGLKKAVPAKQRHERRAFTTAEQMALIRSAQDMREHPFWYYQQRALTDRDLRELLKKDRTELEEKEIQKRSEARSGYLERDVEFRLRQAATALENAGCEPPDWMAEGTFSRYQNWDATQWVRENVNPGPKGLPIASAIMAAERAEQSAERLIRELGNLKEHLMDEHGKKL